MFPSRSLEVSCYQIRGILKNRQHVNQRGTQNVPHFVSQAVSPHSYKYKSKKIATTIDEEDEDKISKAKGDFKYLCKCKTKQAKNTNQSKQAKNYNLNEDKTLNEAHGDDLNEKNMTTKFTLFRRKQGRYTVNPIKKSLVSLYRKQNSRAEPNYIYDKNIGNSMNKKHTRKAHREDKNVNFITTEKRAKHKMKNVGKIQIPLSIGDDKTLPKTVCDKGICRVNAGKAKHHRCICDQNKNNVKSGREKQNGKNGPSNTKSPGKGIFKDSNDNSGVNKNKLLNQCLCTSYEEPSKNNGFTDRLRRAYAELTQKNNNECHCNLHQDSTKNRIYHECLCTEYQTPIKNKHKHHAILGAGDQLLRLECTKKCKNVLSAIFKRNKPPLEFEEKKPQPPLFAIRVDSSNLEVLNSDEIKGRVHTLGKIQKNESCVCPSRLEKAKKYGIGDTCEAGICKLAGNDKYNRFNCKCAKIRFIKCNDTTCDDPKLYTKRDERNNITIVQPSTNDHMFKMVLDSNQMNILNTGEIENVFEKASHTDICKTGICSDHARNKKTVLECKCISKKLALTSNECDERTCRPKRSKFYILCSRIRSVSDRWLWCDSRGGRSYHPNRRQALVLGASAASGSRKPLNRNHFPIYDGMARNIPHDISNDIDYKCNCECKKELNIRKSKKHHKRVKRLRIFQRKELTKNFKKKQKQFSKEQRLKAKEELRKERMERRLEEKKKMEIHKLAMKEAGDGNCLTNFLNGLINLTIQTIGGVLSAVISIIFSPVHSYLYTKNKLKDPIGTAKTFKRWFVNTWKSKESKFSKTITDSETLNVLADHLEESAIFQTFANKGQTQTERHIYEKKAKLRRRRMRKRKEQALYGCRHMLLTTLRRHPCLCVYHICPNFYPQCLSLLTMCGNFAHIILFLAALLCWTPCIMIMELVRGCFCCMFCTH